MQLYLPVPTNLVSTIPQHDHRRSSPPPLLPPVVFTMPPPLPPPPPPSFWQRCKSCFLFPFLAPFLFAKWLWHLLPFTPDKTQQQGQGQQRKKRRTSSNSSTSDNITDFRPPPRWLLRLLSLPLAMLNPPDARHLEHVIGCLDRGEKILLVGNQVGRGREGRRASHNKLTYYYYLPPSLSVSSAWINSSSSRYFTSIPGCLSGDCTTLCLGGCPSLLPSLRGREV